MRILLCILLLPGCSIHLRARHTTILTISEVEIKLDNSNAQY